MTGAGMMDCKKALVETGGDMEAAVQFLREKGLAAAAKKAGRVAAEGVIVRHVTADRKVGALVEVNCETDFVAKNEEFRSFADTVAGLVVTANPADVDALLALPYPGGDKNVGDTLTELIAKIGENQSIRRFERYEVSGDGLVDDYIHMGGRVGVLIELAGTDNAAALELGHELALQIAAMRPRWVAKTDVPGDVLNQERLIEKKRAMEEGKPENIAEKIAEGRVNKLFTDLGGALLEQAWVRDDKKKISQVIKDYSAQAGAELTVRRFARFEVGEGMEKKADDFEAEVRKMAGG